ncbi:hypothetical protein H2LOC_020770 (plasmid) [Methylocystis heyeri]|uniref:YbhB/YbcL family Raf kinase inhibitor-like protein n=1 Tax=Methylocystis heyeri TaxID=391905 RepID=A0A6B8KIV5_9HYPH|nr:hypothetical protein H2LOC_020770 [Methylocystis heyeri]
MNDSRPLGHCGPCPPDRQGVHHYHFRLLALPRADLPFRTHPSYEEVEQEVRKFALQEATLVGIYRR